MATEKPTEETEEIEPEASESNPSESTEAGLDEILSDLPGQMPDVREEVASGIQGRVDRDAAVVDSEGNAFDPSIHLSDNAGNPVLTKTGKLRRRPGRKGGGSTLARPAGAPSGGGGDQSKALAYQQGGELFAGLFFRLASHIDAKEWEPKVLDIGGNKVSEVDALSGAVAASLAKHDVTIDDADTLLLISLGSIIAPRLAMPVTQEKAGKFWRGVKGFFVKAWGYITGGKKPAQLPEASKQQENTQR